MPFFDDAITFVEIHYFKTVTEFGSFVRIKGLQNFYFRQKAFILLSVFNGTVFHNVIENISTQ